MSPAPPARIPVLLVEDSIEEAHLLSALLQRDGRFQVTTAQDGDHGAKLLRQRDFQLLITDINLPGMDGYDLIRVAKEARPDMPVLAMTGYTATHYFDQAYRAGADDILSKPIDRDELLTKVEELLSGERSSKPRSTAAVLAIGGLPGDIEGGCGGTLLRHLAAGHDVLLLPLTGRSRTGRGTADAERRAAELMGARIIISDAAVGGPEDPADHQLLLERIVREMKPHTAFIPCLADDDADRRQAHRISRLAVTDVPTVLTYETATTTPEFKPSRFVDVAPVLDRKLEVLTAYRALPRLDLRSSYVQAAARYWGRYVEFGEAEPFEVMRSDGEDQE